MRDSRIYGHAGGKSWSRFASILAVLLVLAACTTPPTTTKPREAFTLPVLTMAELHRLVDETISAQDEESAQPLAIARVLCGAKGYHPEGSKFANCRARLVKAVTAKPEVLAQAKALARIAKAYAAVRAPKKRKPGGIVSGAGRPPPCYDLAAAKLIVCEDV
ncbi:MAG: hypothetical protein O3B21_10970 [Proteobacteria bacterium]|nr:hypothetical protein [Pseudomonadota bacterium]MDA1357579.1 hypothetical protein [Pseudomonadota bacterium]